MNSGAGFVGGWNRKLFVARSGGLAGAFVAISAIALFEHIAELADDRQQLLGIGFVCRLLSEASPVRPYRFVGVR